LAGQSASLRIGAQLHFSAFFRRLFVYRELPGTTNEYA
jgi:hypothetical protein